MSDDPEDFDEDDLEFAEWQGRVYHPAENWQEIPLEIKIGVIERDKICQCCEGCGRSIHHIIPRAEGGPNTPANLILLCVKCHDEIELAGYRTRADIVGHEPEWMARKARRRAAKAQPNAPKPDWHLWVYGGFRNPNI